MGWDGCVSVAWCFKPAAALEQMQSRPLWVINRYRPSQLGCITQDRWRSGSRCSLGLSTNAVNIGISCEWGCMPVRTRRYLTPENDADADSGADADADTVHFALPQLQRIRKARKGFEGLLSTVLPSCNPVARRLQQHGVFLDRHLRAEAPVDATAGRHPGKAGKCLVDRTLGRHRRRHEAPRRLPSGSGSTVVSTGPPRVRIRRLRRRCGSADVTGGGQPADKSQGGTTCPRISVSVLYLCMLPLFLLCRVRVPPRDCIGTS